jgi:hypothetical protein
LRLRDDLLARTATITQPCVGSYRANGRCTGRRLCPPVRGYDGGAGGVVAGVSVDVASDVGHSLDVHAGLKPGDGRRVPQRMHVHTLDAGAHGQQDA